MYSRVVAALTFASVVLAWDAGQCTTGSLQCCDSIQDAANAHDAFGQLGLGDLLNGITGQVGISCNPITGIGAGQGANCASTPVCCDENNYNGLLNIGCSPVHADA
ncbi:hydrophobin [Coniophora puteana RWD-64-598 SS2]|uniref:Hydrophobin n=1 Tax=Coniophora puteana (strain RWD-64-598) TaxID=741705 RepID=A0A5M3MZS8_CONPW|nr:hydrophobin [Coniophora puteana RWD-64-598 SS2]EIW84314.1 hydrophobin [Coniophora puteana RWD-64-598 SS2]